MLPVRVEQEGAGTARQTLVQSAEPRTGVASGEVVQRHVEDGAVLD